MKRYRRPVGNAILPCGPLNLKTGKAKYFNIIENNANRPDGCLFLVQEEHISPFITKPGTYRVISGSGKVENYKTFGINMRNSFYHDQTCRQMNTAKVIASGNISLQTLQEFAKIIGGNQVSFAVFK